MQKYDVIIIGAGPIGLSCAIRAKQLGLSHLVLEKGMLTHSLYHFPENMTFFSTADRLEIGGVPFVAHNPRPTRREALEYYRRVCEHWQLNLKLYQAVTGLTGRMGDFTVQTSKTSFAARFVIVASGFYDHPVMMQVPGEDLPKVRHYFRDAQPYIGQRLLIIGGGNSAVDAALECWRKGARVTMAIREADFKEGVKYWILPDIKNRIAEGAIRAFFGCRVRAVREQEVLLEQAGKTFTLANDFVLALTGYQPDYTLLQKLGIQIADDEARTPYHDADTFQTNVPGLYLAGVVAGGRHTGKWFIENARHHAQAIFDHLCSQRNKY